MRVFYEVSILNRRELPGDDSGLPNPVGSGPGLRERFAKSHDSGRRRHGWRKHRQPQDVPAAICGNPPRSRSSRERVHARRRWIEGYPTISNDGTLNGGTPFNVTSRTEGFVAPEMGVTQELDGLGMPATFGLG